MSRKAAAVQRGSLSLAGGAGIIKARRVGQTGVPTGYSRAIAAFTLIELLVVIVIIAIISAILFPVFSQARAKARQSVCSSNMRQIGAAILLYQQDYDGCYVPYEVRYPPNRISLDEYYNFGVAEWLKSSVAPAQERYLLEPYIRNDAVRLCPSRKQRYKQGGQWHEGRYTMNGQFSPYFTSPQGRLDSEVSHPSMTMIVWEHYWNSPYCGWGPPQPGPPNGSEEQHWESAHHGGLNILWCDGHVNRMRFRQLNPSMFSIQADPT